MARGPPGSARSTGEAALSGGEAEPGGRAGMAQGVSGGRQDPTGIKMAVPEDCYDRLGPVWDYGLLPLDRGILGTRVFLTFLFLLQLLHDVIAVAALLAAGRVDTEGALAYEGGAAGVEGSRDATLLLPSLLPLQAGRKCTTHSVAQSLPLVDGRRNRSLYQYWADQ